MRRYRRKPQAARRIGVVLVIASVLGLATASWALASGFGRPREIGDCTFTPNRVHLTSTGRLRAGVDISCPKQRQLSSRVWIYREDENGDEVLVKGHIASPVEAKTLQNNPTTACRRGEWDAQVQVKVDKHEAPASTVQVRITHC